MDERNAWIDIITKLYTHLHESKRVMHTSKESDKKRDRIINYFDRLEKVHQKVSNSKSKSAEKLLKKFYYDLYVIKPENIPQSYFQNELRIARERGYGDIELTDERKQILINQIIEDQKESLDKWIEYFLYDEESKSYEPWEKYWVFQGLQKLGKFDKETGKFSKRDKTTVYPFPPVEREAIFTTLKLMEDYIKDKTSEDEIKDALGQGNFKTLYEYSLKQMLNKGENKALSTEGIWIKYDQGSDYNILRNSLQGYYTGWCTAAGENFAKTQLDSGDFYVYYSKDENNEPKIPRIAIRMEGHDTIGEIRGIADNQNIEEEMLPILDQKLEEFPDRDKYRKKEYDMQFLTTIDKKVKKGIELTAEELRFLYEIDSIIEGFGYDEDPRIEELLSKRNIKEDLSKVFNCSEEEIGINKKDLERPLKYYRGNIVLNGLTNADGLQLPEIIAGSLSLARLTNADGLILPKQIGGNLELRNLITAEGLQLSEKIGGDLNLAKLTSAEGLIFPKQIGGSLNLESLANTEGLQLPEIIGSQLILSNLTTVEGLQLPKQIGDSLDLCSLTSAYGIIFPEYIGNILYLNNLTNAVDLILPKQIGGNLDLGSLTSVESLTLPKQIGGSLYLNGLTNAEGLTLPEHIGCFLDLRNLKSADGLNLPTKLEGSLFLATLTSAEGLHLPKEIEGDLDLRFLTSAEGLQLPEIIGSQLILSNLTSAEGLTLPEHIGSYLYLNKLTSVKGLKLPSDFEIERLQIIPNFLEEIKSHPEKYFRTKEEEQLLFHSDNLDINNTINDNEEIETEINKRTR